MAHGLLPAFELKQTKKRDSLALSGFSNGKCACCGGFAGHPDAVFSKSIDAAGIQKLMSLYPWIFFSTEEDDDKKRRIGLYNALHEIASSFPDLISAIYMVQNPQSLVQTATPYLQHRTTLSTAQQMAAVQTQPVQGLPDNSRLQPRHAATHEQASTYRTAASQLINLHAYQSENSLPPSDDDLIVPSSDTLCSSPLYVISKVKA